MVEGRDEGSPEGQAGGVGRVSFERLRERTDELELIISGLSLLALVSLPGWLWGAYESYYPRMSLGLVAASAVLLPMLSAICMVMAALLLLHLGVRAHWVGLIGLKAAFPDGIRWDRLRGVGGLTTASLQARVPSVDQGIARADRLASTLFSLITFSALALAVLGLWLTALFIVAGLFGESLGGTNTFLNRAVGWIFIAYFGAPLLRWLLDGVLVRRVPGLAGFAPLRWTVALLGWIEALFLPPRLLGSIRLTLQSHLLPRAFLVCFVGAMLAVAFGSNRAFQVSRSFDLLDTQRHVGTRATYGGVRSAHYESQRIARDALQPVPSIPAPTIESAWLPLFLPYVALMDDPVLDQRCPRRERWTGTPFGFDPGDSDAEAKEREARIDAEAAATADCLRSLWEVRLDDRPQSLAGFLPAERADLGLRGLAGWLPLNGLAPGPHRLEVIWRPRPEQDAVQQDYVPKRLRHVIPFVWDPEAAAVPALPAD